MLLGNSTSLGSHWSVSLYSEAYGEVITEKYLPLMAQIQLKYVYSGYILTELGRR